MQKKVIGLALVTLALCVSAVSAFAYIEQKRISNEIDYYTYLQSPIRLTKVGDLPSQVIIGEDYTMHFIIENLAKKVYSGSIVIQISAGYYCYPVYPPTPSNITINSSGQIATPPTTIVPPPYNYRQLTPDMISMKWNGNYTVELKYDDSTGALVGRIGMSNLAVGYYGDAKLTVTFNDSAITDTSYYISAWMEQA